MDNFFEFYTKDKVNMWDVQSAFRDIMGIQDIEIPDEQEFAHNCPVLVPINLEAVGTDYNITWPDGVKFNAEQWMQKLAAKLKTHVVANIGEQWKVATPDGFFYTPIVDDEDNITFKPARTLQTA